jgi:hypothetical protein
LDAVIVPRRRGTLRPVPLHLKHHILPAMGKLRLNQLTPSNVALFRDHLLTKLSRPMAKKVLTSFKDSIRSGSRGYVTGNVAKSSRSEARAVIRSR